MGRRTSYNRGISSTPPEFRIFGESFLAGIFAGAAIKLGINADPIGILQTTTKQTIEALETINPERDNTSFLVLFGFACFIASIIGFVEIITQVDDWRFGVFIYIIGFIFGFFLTLSAL